MSVWTYVKCEIRIPEYITMDELKEVFGKELKLRWVHKDEYVDENGELDREAYLADEEKADKENEALWAEYEANKDAFLPTGSEGSLEYVPCRRAARKVDDKYVYKIAGSLRDTDCEDKVVFWFRDRFLGLSNKHKNWLFNEYAIVKASSGVGELIWEYGKYD